MGSRSTVPVPQLYRFPLASACIGSTDTFSQQQNKTIHRTNVTLTLRSEIPTSQARTPIPNRSRTNPDLVLLLHAEAQQLDRLYLKELVQQQGQPIPYELLRRDSRKAFRLAYEPAPGNRREIGAEFSRRSDYDQAIQLLQTFGLTFSRRRSDHSRGDRQSPVRSSSQGSSYASTASFFAQPRVGSIRSQSQMDWPTFQSSASPTTLPPFDASRTAAAGVQSSVGHAQGKDNEQSATSFASMSSAHGNVFITQEHQREDAFSRPQAYTGRPETRASDPATACTTYPVSRSSSRAIQAGSLTARSSPPSTSRLSELAYMLPPPRKLPFPTSSVATATEAMADVEDLQSRQRRLGSQPHPEEESLMAAPRKRRKIVKPTDHFVLPAHGALGDYNQTSQTAMSAHSIRERGREKQTRKGPSDEFAEHDTSCSNTLSSVLGEKHRTQENPELVSRQHSQVSSLEDCSEGRKEWSILEASVHRKALDSRRSKRKHTQIPFSMEDEHETAGFDSDEDVVLALQRLDHLRSSRPAEESGQTLDKSPQRANLFHNYIDSSTQSHKTGVNNDMGTSSNMNSAYRDVITQTAQMTRDTAFECRNLPSVSNAASQTVGHGPQLKNNLLSAAQPSRGTQTALNMYKLATTNCSLRPPEKTRGTQTKASYATVECQTDNKTSDSHSAMPSSLHVLDTALCLRLINDARDFVHDHLDNDLDQVEAGASCDADWSMETMLRGVEALADEALNKHGNTLLGVPFEALMQELS